MGSYIAYLGIVTDLVMRLPDRDRDAVVDAQYAMAEEKQGYA